MLEQVESKCAHHHPLLILHSRHQLGNQDLAETELAHLCRVCVRYVVLMEAAVAVGEGHHTRNTLRYFFVRWHTVAERMHKIRQVIERTECVCPSSPSVDADMGANSRGVCCCRFSSCAQSGPVHQPLHLPSPPARCLAMI